MRGRGAAARTAASVAVAVAALAAVSAGCGAGASGGAGGDDGEIVVFAAASLTDAFAAIESAFEVADPDRDVVLNLAGSSTLREQILAGAPADVFASADEANVARLEQAGALGGEPEVLARNRMQIAVPAGNPAGVADLAAFADEGLLIGLCAPGVPCGDLAREALGRAGVEPAPDTNEPDVRALLTKVAAGELDAGIVYATDVAAAGGAVEGIELPPGAEVAATYAIAPLAESADPAGAARFVEFALSGEGRRILADHGFALP